MTEPTKEVSPYDHQSLSRGAFIKISVVAGVGLTLGVSWRATQTPDLPFSDAAFVPNAYLRIDTDGSITILVDNCLLYTSPSPRDGLLSRMPSSA